MTFDEIRVEVRRRIAEVSATFWTDEEVEQAIHDGEDELADATEWYEKFQYIDLLPHRPYYDLRSVLRRHEFLVAGPSFNATTSRWLVPVRPADFESADPRWEERYAEPEYSLMRGLWWLRFHPVAAIEGTQVKQFYVAMPRHMDEDTDEPGFHRPFHYGIVEYAVCDLLAQDAETSLALSAWKLYKVYEDGLAAYVGSRASVPMVHGHQSGKEY